MENLPISQKLARFKHCNHNFHPYIEKVLIRLPEKICFNEVLDDLNFEIVSFNKDVDGQYYQLLNQATVLKGIQSMISPAPPLAHPLLVFQPEIRNHRCKDDAIS